MTLTYDMLVERNACAEWLEIFQFRCPNGLRLETKADLILALRLGGFGPVVNWFSDRLGSDFGHLFIDGRLDLYRANLSGANLYRADLTGANLTGAIGLPNVTA